MSVLTLTGKQINWAKPPKATTRVMWSRRDMYGRKVTGSLRTISHLDYMDTLAVKKFGVHIVVIQPPFNIGVAASAGTHDYDACLDVYIPGVAWLTQEKFFRANGAGAYWRRPPLFGNHIHYFCLPPREGKSVSDDYRIFGFKVGKFVDGGWSLFGRKTTSAQIDDYYAHRNALANHAKDGGWFPSSITATIFNWGAYLKSKVGTTTKTTTIKAAHLNIPAPGVGSRGGDLGNDAARIKVASSLVAKAGPHFVTWNELGPRKSNGTASTFAHNLDAAFSERWRLVIPNKDWNENYISYRGDLLTVLGHFPDVILIAEYGSGNKHMTPVTFKHEGGLEFTVGVTHLPPGATANAEKDRQAMAKQAMTALARIANGRPYFLAGDMNTAKDLTALVAGGMKRTRKFADKSDGAKATYTNYDKSRPSTNAADWEIDQQYASKHWYVVTYAVVRFLTALGNYVKPRASDHDMIVSTIRAEHR